MKRNVLVTALENRRDELGLNDAQFAVAFGFTQSGWSRIQSGEREPSIDLLEAVMQTWPDLVWAVNLMLIQGRAYYRRPAPRNQDRPTPAQKRRAA